MIKAISPYAFLKSRRPHEFSDSLVVRKARLERGFIDFYLNSLTSRSEEKRFELFCKRMAEYEICPNLLTQTGPTGGGDSKVDSETYPVSDDGALAWYGGIGREAASERWAFAFSAKKDWRSKIKSDVANIISTQRDYKRIFFISNQYVPDKKRASTEDELSNEYGLGITILDRSWLLDKLFANHHEQIAVDIFELSDSFLDEQKIGPLDFERQQELEKIELEIKQSITEGKHRFALVEKSITSAVLSRELELPLDKTLGRFNRASLLAEKYGTITQIKECIYEWAWSLYWWYQEYDEFYKKYCDYEKIIIGTNSAFDIERLTNLWMNLYTITEGKYELRNFHHHTEVIISEYKRNIEDKSRPNTALEARANYVFVKLMLGYDANELLAELHSIIKECDGVIDFSMETISKMIMGISPVVQDTPNFDTVFEAVVSISSNRKQELVSARMLLDRGRQLVENKPYSAIRYIGRALLKLYKEESKKEFLSALFLMASASERVDLLWVARGFYFNAFYISLIDYMKFGSVSPFLVGCSYSIMMLELQQGRLPQTLEWYKLSNIMKGILSSSGYDSEKLAKLTNDEQYDSILGMLLLRTPHASLSQVSFLPDALDRIGLYLSSIALKYALGYIDEDFKKSLNLEEDAFEEFMNNWYNQPAKEQIPSFPVLGSEDTKFLGSKILGCTITIVSDVQFPCTELAESILAAIESFLSTTIVDNVTSLTPKLTIRVKYQPAEQYRVYYQKEETDGEPSFTVICSTISQSDFRLAQNTTKEFILELIAELVPNIVIFKDFEKQIESMARDDLVFSRALDFTGSIFIVADLIGIDAMSINNFIIEDDKEYSLKRDTPLMPRREEDSKEIRHKDKVLGSEVAEPQIIGHKDIEILSVINLRLWDKAKWQGMLFGGITGSKLPILAPVFKDKDAGIAIFNEWLSLTGKADEKNIINVGLIKGVDQKYPKHYKAIFTANTDVLLETKQPKLITVPSRFRTMESEDNRYLLNFERFVNSIDYGWKYYLAPACIDSKNGQLELVFEYAILKNYIQIKNAWEIDSQSWLSFAITLDDDPIIPPSVIVAPINEVFRRLKL